MVIEMKHVNYGYIPSFIAVIADGLMRSMNNKLRKLRKHWGRGRNKITVTKSILLSDSEKLALATKTLESVLNGCLHPDIAIVRVLTPMEPIRSVLKKIKA